MRKYELSARPKRLSCLSVILMLLLPCLLHAAGLKKVVAVQDFVDKAGNSQWTTGEDYDLGRAMADQLTDALVQSGQFIVLERVELGSVLNEQDMAASGRFQQSQSARMGKLTSAQVLVQGVVTEMETHAKKGGSGISFSGIRFGRDTQEVHIGLIIRLIDTTTGEVIDSQRVEGMATQTGTNVGLSASGLNLGNSSETATPMGKAIQIAIDDAVEYVAGRLRNVAFQGRVIKADGDVVYISAGDKNAVVDGDVFLVYSVGEELVDPVTGELLGNDEELIGRATVFDVKEKYSKARVSGNVEAKVGDTVRDEFEG